MPSGYVQTGGGPNGGAGDTYYTIIAAAGHNYSGYNFDDYPVPTCYPSTSLKVRLRLLSTTVSSLTGTRRKGTRYVT